MALTLYCFLSTCRMNMALQPTKLLSWIPFWTTKLFNIERFKVMSQRSSSPTFQPYSKLVQVHTFILILEFVISG